MSLDNTSNCPIGARCESCGTTKPRAVHTATTPVGVICLTLCDRCASSSLTPRLAAATAARFVLDHCGHLGIDADQMEALMKKEAGCT